MLHANHVLMAARRKDDARELLVFLSLVQMKDKMVLSCLKLKRNNFKPLKQSMFAFTTKTF